MYFSVLSHEVAIFTDAYTSRPLWVLCTESPQKKYLPENPAILMRPAELCLVRALIINKGRAMSTDTLMSLRQDVDGLVKRTRDYLEQMGDRKFWLMTRSRAYAFKFDPKADTLDIDLCDHELHALERSMGFDDPLLIAADSDDQTAGSRPPRTGREAVIGWHETLQETVLTDTLPVKPREPGVLLWGPANCTHVERLKYRAMRLRALMHDHDREFATVLSLARQLKDVSSDHLGCYDQLVAEAAFRAEFPAPATPSHGLDVIDRWFSCEDIELTATMRQIKEDLENPDLEAREAACQRWLVWCEGRDVGSSPPVHRAPRSDPETLADDRLTWEQVEHGLSALVANLGDWCPDLIVGINRGGAIVGGMLAKRLRIRTIAVISLVSAKSIRGLNVIQHPQDDPTVERILIVDEAYRTSSHCSSAVEYLGDKSRFPRAELKTAMLVRLMIHDDERGSIDFCAFERRYDVRFPWDIDPA